jgi:hypothetical protein
MKSKSLGSIKISESTYQNMLRAIEKYNNENLFKVNQAQFRRMALMLLSQMILENQKIPIKLQSD